jgi:hypothetical protein
LPDRDLPRSVVPKIKLSTISHPVLFVVRRWVEIRGVAVVVVVLEPIVPVVMVGGRSYEKRGKPKEERAGR